MFIPPLLPLPLPLLLDRRVYVSSRGIEIAYSRNGELL